MQRFGERSWLIGLYFLYLSIIGVLFKGYSSNFRFVEIRKERVWIEVVTKRIKGFVFHRRS